MDEVTTLERAYDQLAGVVGKLGPEDLSAATPCAGWDVRTLLNHTFGAAWMFTMVNRGESVGEGAGDLVGTDPSGALAKVREANLAAWRAPGSLEGERTYPFGTFPARAAEMINVGEVLLHAWDVAKATGQDLTLDPVVAQAVFDFYRPVPMDEYRAHGAFGAEIPVPESSPASDRLLGFLGRHP